MTSTFMAHRLARQITERDRSTGPVIKRGAEILAGPYPQSFGEFIGQYQARVQIISSITSANERDAVMDHVLLASGLPGIGKTTLGRLIAHLNGVGFVELGGVVTEKDVAKALGIMKRGDVLFLDEVHRLVSRGKAKAEWLLTLLQDGELQMPTGVVKSPGITIIAATTDAEKLPETILDRFAIKPILDEYNTAEAIEIAKVTAARLGFGKSNLPMPEETGWLQQVADACTNNPRRMGMLLTSVRDIVISDGVTARAGMAPEPGAEPLRNDQGYSIKTALDWNGLTPDGLTQMQQTYLMGLFAYGGSAGLSTLKALIQTDAIGQTEKHLIQKGYVLVKATGRELTDFGTERAAQLVESTIKEGTAA